MMKTYAKNIEDRKAIVKRLEQLTGIKAYYTRMPTCSFEIGDYTVERNGRVTVPEDSEMIGFAETLVAEGLVILESAIDEPNGEMEAPSCEQNDAEQPLEVVISLPVQPHTQTSLRNLIAMVYSRGELISKATGGHFYCADELMAQVSAAVDISEILTVIHDGGLEGLTIDTERITFTGFPQSSAPERIRVFTQLASRMCALALKQKHTQAKRTEEPNERYIFRIWLLAMGMAGEEYAEARRILLSPLSGSAAFKDAAMEERWKTNRKAEKAVAVNGTPEPEEVE